LFVSVSDDAEAARLTPPLLARAGTLTIRVPPLRERLADWPRFLPAMLAQAAAAARKPHLALSLDADQALGLHTWPGNFRELAQTLRTAALHAAGDRIELADLPFAFRSEPPPQEPKLPLDDLMQNAERRLIQLALDQSGNNKSKAAQILGIWRPRLLRRMEQLGIADSGSPGDEPTGGSADA
jgi:DNA-binding NtrC family response regulator